MLLVSDVGTADDVELGIPVMDVGAGALYSRASLLGSVPATELGADCPSIDGRDGRCGVVKGSIIPAPVPGSSTDEPSFSFSKSCIWLPLRDFLRQHKSARTAAPRATRPPTTPPAIAPAFVRDFFLPCEVLPAVVSSVGIAEPEVDDEGDLVELVCPRHTSKREPYLTYEFALLMTVILVT